MLCIMNLPHRAPTAFTSAEFTRLVRSGGFGRARVELRRGMIVKMNPQYVPHAKAKTLLAKAIKDALTSAGLAWEVFQEVSVDFAEDFQPAPDIVVWDPAAAPADLDGPVPASAVRLVVEVSDSSLLDDLGAKLEEYAAAGLAEYWVADVKGRLILRHTDAKTNTYGRREVARFGEMFSSLAYASLLVDTSELA